MKKEYIRVFSCILIICICLTGCTKPQAAAAPITPETSASFSSPAESAVVNTPTIQHITQNVCHNLVIDADITVPEQEKYCTYQLEMINCDPDRLFGIFCPDGSGSYTSQAPSYPGESSLVYTSDRGHELVVANLAIHYTAYDYGSDVPIQEVSNLLYYHTLEHPDATPHDLSFMTVAEMEAYGMDVLSQLGIGWEPKLSKCVTLSGQEILDFQEEMFAGSIYGATSTPTRLNTADDTCYLEFTFSYDGTPIFNRDEPSLSSYSGNLTATDASATILINAQGIQDFMIFSPYMVANNSEPQPILSWEDAAALLKEEYNTNVPFEQMTITDIWLEYIPFFNQPMRMEPYWCFARIDETRIGNPGYVGNADRINAITGTNLAYE